MFLLSVFLSVSLRPPCASLVGTIIGGERDGGGEGETLILQRGMGSSKVEVD